MEDFERSGIDTRYNSKLVELGWAFEAFANEKGEVDRLHYVKPVVFKNGDTMLKNIEVVKNRIWKRWTVNIYSIKTRNGVTEKTECFLHDEDIEALAKDLQAVKEDKI